jgi:hypothetical protein
LLNVFNLENVKEIEQNVSILVSKYFDSLKYRNDIAEQKVGTKIGDDYFLIASHYLIQLYQQSKDFSYLSFSVSLLEHGISRNQDNFQFKILLCRIYCHLGCIEEALDIFYTLDIKHIQWETLSYFIFHDILNSPGYTEKSLILLERMSSFISEHERETPELLVYNYQNESYSKIKEFNEFKLKLDNSLQFSKVKCFTGLLKLRKNNTSLEDSENYLESYLKKMKPISDNLNSNEDVECISIYDSKNSKIFDFLYPKESLSEISQRILNLKIYHSIPHLIKSSVRLASLNDKKQPKKNKNPQDISIPNLVQQEEEIFLKQFEEFKQFVQNEKGWEVSIQMFDFTSKVFQYLFQVKSSKSAEKEIEEINKELKKFSILMEETIMSIIPEAYSNDIYSPIEFILGKQLNFFITIFPAWLNVLKTENSFKAELLNLKSKFLSSLDKFKIKIEQIKKNENFLNMNETLTEKLSSEIHEKYQKEFISFSIVKHKQLNHQIELSFSKILRVVSDLSLEMNTFRI